MDEFTIRTGVIVSHWLSQSNKQGDERKNYTTRADFETINWISYMSAKWVQSSNFIKR